MAIGNLEVHTHTHTRAPADSHTAEFLRRLALINDCQLIRFVHSNEGTASRHVFDTPSVFPAVAARRVAAAAAAAARQVQTFPCFL